MHIGEYFPFFCFEVLIRDWSVTSASSDCNFPLTFYLWITRYLSTLLFYLFAGEFIPCSACANDLGDYIYESGTGGTAIGRVPSKAKELASLDDYRKRYAQYRTDVGTSLDHGIGVLILTFPLHLLGTSSFLH